MIKNNKLLLAITMALSSGLVKGAPVGFTYNFANIADKTSLPGDWGSNPVGEKGGQPLTFTRPTNGTGPGLSAYGYKNVNSIGDTDTKTANAYLDSKSSGLSAGLGVCGALNGSYQCSPNNYDNIMQNEMLELQFTSAVSLTDIFFKNGEHKTEWTNSVGSGSSRTYLGFYINGVFVKFGNLTNSGVGSGSRGYLSLTELTTLGLATSSRTWTFLNLNTTPNVKKELYISSITGLLSVPVPAVIWLFGSGLAGLIGATLRKSKTAI